MQNDPKNGCFFFFFFPQCGLITKLREIFVNLSQFLVPEIGLEPIRFVQPRDFKSLASAYSAIRAYLFIFCIKFHMQGILSPLRLPVSPYSQICSCAVEIATSALNYIRSRTLCQDFCRQCAPFAAPQRRLAAHICMRKHCPNYTNNMMTPTRSPTNIAKAGALERHIRMDSGSSSPKTT